MTRRKLIGLCLAYPGAYEDVRPGWHLNKRHWNTVVTGGDVPYDELVEMIAGSYDLVKPKVRRR
jgi:predicted DNA-binding protein (MmcQ/YjbR family)